MTIGTAQEDIDTPALLIDLDRMEQNISKMADFFSGKTSTLWAHTKVHRSPFLAHKQIKSGAAGICCQKVEAAEIMAASGINPILVTNVVATPSKIERLVGLAKHSDVTVEVDGRENVELISRAATKSGVTIKVLVDIHIGSHRFGCEPGEEALELAKYASNHTGIVFRGLMGNDAHLGRVEPRSERRRQVENAEKTLTDSKQIIERTGLKVEEVSTGSTGSYDVSASNPEVTGVQAGSYLLMDSEYHSHVPEFFCALTVLSTVISKHPNGIIVLDAGMASISSASGLPKLADNSAFDTKNLEVYQLNAENCLVKEKRSCGIRVGDKLELIPSYLDATVIRHEKFHGMRNSKIEIEWPVLGRSAST